MAWPAAPASPTHRRATSDAAPATITTRRYCIKATSLASAPKSADINIIAEAPPGAIPHTAGRSGQNLHPGDHPPQGSTRGDDRRHDGDEKRPVLEKGEDDLAGDRAGHQAADHRLRRDHRQARRAYAATIGADQDARQHRAQQQGSRHGRHLQHRSNRKSKPTTRIAHCADLGSLSRRPGAGGSDGAGVMIWLVAGSALMADAKLRAGPA